ncbi:MAG: YidC/Oxa1 family insertase periplasmic-domain containing protein [Phycisphaeraceae bacterium]|nr:MAG: YidC/Oxa1 family insertase periplasmic-domain containing protein [Phycisphaeraceae bacterium]
MNPALRRLILTLVVLGATLGVVAVMVFGPKGPGRQQSSQNSADATSTPDNAGGSAGGTSGGAADPSHAGAGETPGIRGTDNPGETPPTPPSGETGGASEGAGRDADQNEGQEQPTTPPGGEQPAVDPASHFAGLTAVAPSGGFGTSRPRPIGSLDWRQHDFLVEFSTISAGIERITLSDIWNTAAARRQAEKLKPRIERGEATLAEMPSAERYVIQQARPMRVGGYDYTFPALAARAIRVTPAATEGGPAPTPQEVNLFADVWSQDGADPGLFTTEVRNQQGAAVLRITRRYVIAPSDYALTIEQRVENLSDVPVDVSWIIYGQTDLDQDRARYMENRRYRAGHLADTKRYPQRTLVIADDDFLLSRGTVMGIGGGNLRYPGTEAMLWPNADSLARNYELSWYAVENRYFAAAIMPPYAGDGSTPPSRRTLSDVIGAIVPFYNEDDAALRRQTHDWVVLELRGVPRRVAPGATESFDMGLYAGPLDRHVLESSEPYVSLRMGGLIHYQMSAMCAWCTFQWLAHVLIWILSVAHAIFADWGVAIILLVAVVRLLLHPITKRSQVSMQRFARVMQKLKPEIEKLQQKYGSDPKRMQQEQLRLWREHGVSPFSMLGCLPLFLQMPIWIALYAMLYFAFDLRHEPAFWGVFQVFWDWPFLADLSESDHFFGEVSQPFTFLFIPITGINILPVLLGLVFYVQQKYMTPPPTATMTPEQMATQRMMKWMLVLMMPLVMYGAPSGLTLYIISSSIWGIIESRIIRKHVDSLDLDQLSPKLAEQKKKPRNALQRMYMERLENARQRAEAKRQGPTKKYKKRG